MAKKKFYSVQITEGVSRSFKHSMKFSSEKEANAAFIYVCGLQEMFPHDVQLCSYNLDTKTNRTTMWTTLRYRKYFEQKNEREAFNMLCSFATSKMYLTQKALENNEKPYGTVCDWMADNFTYEDLPLKVQSDISKAVCEFYGIEVA